MLDFFLDYITSTTVSTAVPSGYASLGPNGGDGSWVTGTNHNWLLSWNTTLAKDLNNTGYCSAGNCAGLGTNLLVNSPPTVNNTSYQLPSGSPYAAWDFVDGYEMVIDGAAFGGVANFNGVSVGLIHDSPPKHCTNNAVYPTPCGAPGVLAKVSITKMASPTTAVFGQQVTFTYVVTNTGNVALTNVKVVDDNGTPSWTADDFTVGTVASLAPGASQTFTSTRVPPAPVCSSGSGGSGGGCGQLITEHRPDGKTKFTYLQAKDDRDSYQSWWGWSGSRSYSHYAHMRIYDKDGNTRQDVDATPGAGDDSHFNSFSCLVDKSAVVKSDGCSVNLPDIWEKKGWNKDWHLDWDWGWGDSSRQHYWDDSYSGHSCDWDTNTYPDECPGTSTNTATVTASWSGGTVSATDNASVDLVAKLTPKVSITKTANTVQAAPGAAVTYTYVVTNTGGLTLTNLVVVDDNGTPTITADDVTVGTIASLAPGQSVTMTRTIVPPAPVCDGGGGCGMLITQHLGNGTTKFTYMQAKDDRDSYRTPSGWLGSRSYAHRAKIRVYDKTGGIQDIDSTPGSGDGSSYFNSFSVVVNTASIVKSDGCSVNLPDVFYKKGWDGDWH